ncbi:MAG: hypothetical protein H7A51_07700 [Akkermansiaceae bacterium]|nr:hypothetical protein [Akkermansiaceae bacterium]
MVYTTNNPAQDTFGNLLNAPRPFCVIDARLKSLKDEKLPNKTWLHTIPAHSYGAATSTRYSGHSDNSYYTHPYSVTFKQVNSYEQAGDYVQRVPGDDSHGYFGSSYQPDGQTYITGREIPLVPLTSLAQLQNLPQHPIDALNWSGHGAQNNAIGNSFASPSIESNKIKTSAEPFHTNGYLNQEGGRLDGTRLSNTSFVSGTSHIDRSYAANHLLWDDYFFSSLAPQNGSFYQKFGKPRTLHQVATSFFSGNDFQSLPNTRYLPYLGGKTGTELVDSLVSQGDTPTPGGYEKLAAHLLVSGGFNINSTSESAWANLIASAHLKQPVVLDPIQNKGPTPQPAGEFIVSRYTLPNGEHSSAGGTDLRWRSYRELTDDEVEQLAKAIVAQVKKRGPFRSLGEFINRRLGSAGDETSLYGALQAALEDPSVDINKDYRNDVITAADIAPANYKFPAAATGSRYQGAPAYVTQADILQPIAPVITARSDTFIVRGYGDSVSADGNKVLARAYYEAVVQRYPEYLDTQDAPEVSSADLTAVSNQRFGRRFRIRSFRWLSHDEI